jgi:hypothetical protein
MHGNAQYTGMESPITKGHEMRMLVEIIAEGDEEFTEQDMQDALRARLDEFYPVTGGTPVYPTVRILDGKSDPEAALAAINEILDEYLNAR